MLKFSYFAMLLFTVVGSIWLEIFLKVGVLRRLKRAVLSIIPTAIIFLVWDYYAVVSGHWWFDKEQVVGIFGPKGIPLEEFLFFIVVPLASLLTIEAVRTQKRHWKFGDEA
ncbi:MAG: lycopene cyclase domain-containing protein [Candidatus Nanopelagicaceae bacterium]|nr:lycopene cyclase domain-containing protein [Actinomycetales bacterium]